VDSALFGWKPEEQDALRCEPGADGTLANDLRPRTVMDLDDHRRTFVENEEDGCVDFELRERRLRYHAPVVPGAVELERPNDLVAGFPGATRDQALIADRSGTADDARPECETEGSGTQPPARLSRCRAAPR
jgi:hypothetical protein